MSAAKKAGVIYILTNPSFPDYVKIGYATNIENRLKQLNRSECIPFAFRVYATYDVSTPLQDKELHSLIDRLNPDLRAIDTFDGKTRTKEFYAMTKEDAYALLESIAKLSGTMDKLQRLTPEGHEIADEEVAAEIQEEAKERKAPFSFIKCGIPMGAALRGTRWKSMCASAPARTESSTESTCTRCPTPVPTVNMDRRLWDFPDINPSRFMERRRHSDSSAMSCIQT